MSDAASLLTEDTELVRLTLIRDEAVVEHTDSMEQYAYIRQRLDVAQRQLGAATEALVAYKTRPRSTFEEEEPGS